MKRIDTRDPTRFMQALAVKARAAAVRAGFWDGRNNQELIRRCRHIFGHGDTVAVVIFTRDAGHHSSGWWKNPDYERCEHLSLSFVDAETKAPAPQDHKRAHAWCRAFFRDYTRLLWVEPPHSELGKRSAVYHYRLFMHPDWKTPLLPRGEVYTRQFTEVGWKSFSELHDARDQANEADQRTTRGPQ